MSSYQVDLDVKKVVAEDALKTADAKTEVCKQLKKMFEERYLNQAQTKSEKKATGVKYLYEKLAF